MAGSREFPPVPESLNAETFRSTYDNRNAIEPRADTAPNVTPYLSLASRLSQSWINRWTILIVLILVRLVILAGQLHDNIGSAKAQALSACTKVEDIGSAMASMPHYLSVGVNDLAASGIEKAVHGMVELLDLVIIGVQELIIFYINFLTATYACLIAALVHGSLEIVANVTASATKAFNSVINDTTTEIDSIAASLQASIQNFTDGIENSIIGKIIPPVPQVNLSAPISTLHHFNISADGFLKDIQTLDKDLPTFEEVQNLTETAISYPFGLLRQALNETYGNYTFNKTAFPLAQKEQLTFCSDNNTLDNFFAELFSLAHKAKVAFIVILSLAAVLAMVPMAYLETRRWKRQRKHAKLISSNQYDSMDVVYIASRPFTSTIGIKIASHFKGQKQILVRWCIAYATSPQALFVLSIALTGFLSCIFQATLLHGVQKEVPKLSGEVGAFADNVVSHLQNSSNQWANGANGVITGLNNDINDDVLGYVSNATEAVNKTLNTFLDKMEEGLEFAFNDTILLDPIKSVIHCVIGLKIESVQKGLTWVHDHAHVEFPLFPNDMFSAGANDSIAGDSDLKSFLASPSSVSSDEVTGALSHVTNWLHANVIQEALTSTGLLLVYVIVVLIGVVRMLVGMSSPERSRAEGGTRYPSNDQASDTNVSGYAGSRDGPPVWEFGTGSTGHDDASEVNYEDQLPPKYSGEPRLNNPYDYNDQKERF